MKTNTLKHVVLLASLFLVMGKAGAEDIDIYSGSGASGTPNIVTVIDNSGSWSASTTITNCPDGAIDSTMLSTAGGFEACGFYNALTQIKNSPALVGKINMGLMLFGQGSTQGGVFKSPPANPAPGNLNLMDNAGITAMQQTVTNLKGSGGSNDTANGTDVGGSMQEAWAYYTGNTGISGTKYTAPNTGACGKNFVIYIGISRTSSNPADFNANNVFDHLVSAGANSDQQTFINYQTDINGDGTIDNKYSVKSNYWGDEWTRFNFQHQQIVTYTIVLKDPQNPNPDYEAFLKSMALNGGGKYFEVNLGDMDALVQALLLIFNEVQAVNSVFASASLPISVNAQGTFLNQIYMGMFRPDANGLPRWAGNLKQYQFGVDNTDPNNPTLFLADATGAQAISSAGTGFISANAQSFWTYKDTTVSPDAPPPTGTNGFWVNNPQSVGQAFDLPDGEVVEKGGVGQQIRRVNLTDDYTANPSTPRKVYTCTTSCTGATTPPDLSTTPFATTNSEITAALLGTTLPSVGVSSITRNSTTATATLASSMSPALTAGQSVTVSGSQYSQFNGTFSAGGPPTATTFTYTITTNPPTPSTGSYTATVPSNPQSVTSLSRSATTVTATVPGHGYAVGQNVTITGATGTEYNGTFAVTSVPDANTFTYTIVDGPVTPGSGGTATVGANSFSIVSIVRAPSNSSNVSRVTVTTATNNLGWQTGTSITINNASPAGYNGTRTAVNCPGSPKTSFCFDMSTTPASPDATVGMKADAVVSSATITGLTRTTNTCSGGSPSPAATVTATTSAPHPFLAGQTISIGGTPGANEAAYIGTFSVQTVPSGTTFTYQINTTPGCTDTTSGMTAATFGVDRDTLINWVRGKDSIGDEPSPGNGITIRPSVHGDVLHSRPAVIAYPNDTTSAADVVVFYGSNGGAFRAINGNQTVDINGVKPGGELWSFIPTEFYPKLQRLYFNSPVIQLESTPTGITPTPQPKDYFFDGSIGIYQDVQAGKAVIFLSARRGGRVLYAIDVSDPSVPKFLWKRTNADLPELGQTWSTPKAAFVTGHTGPVLIFGGGYSPSQDTIPPTADTMGRAIYILDALTGDLVWKATFGGSTNLCTSGLSMGGTCQLRDMTYSIPSDITLVDRNGDLKIDRLYAVDVGGNVWRVDLEPDGQTDPKFWQASKIAEVGGTNADGVTKRKVFFPPDVIFTSDFDAILVGTGDREHPTLADASATNVINRFYMLKDLNNGNNACPLVPPISGTPTCQTPIQDITDNTANNKPADLFDATTTPFDINDTVDKGFYITLQQTGEMGEKVVNAPVTVGGLTFFGTNTPIPPDPTICSANLGTARGYAVNVLTGVSQFVVFAGGGLPPSPVTGLVSIDVGGKEEKFFFLIGGGGAGNAGCTTPDCLSPVGGQKPVISVSPIRKRIFWYREHDK